MFNLSFNFGFITLLFFLIKFNILLLNEETLILFCFVLFCFLSVNKLGDQVTRYFQEQALSIKNGFTQSNKQFLELMTEDKARLKRTFSWPFEGSNLKQHFLTFNSTIIKQLPHVYLTKVKVKLTKKLIFSQRLEQQVTKLVSLVILEKVKQNISVQQFCTKKLILKRFNSLEKTYFREHLSKLN